MCLGSCASLCNQKMLWTWCDKKGEKGLQYHRSHLNKVMMVIFTCLAFEDNIDNGGEAFNLGLIRCQSAKISKKLVWEGHRQEDGSI